jgi:hypothetical protein
MRYLESIVAQALLWSSIALLGATGCFRSNDASPDGGTSGLGGVASLSVSPAVQDFGTVQIGTQSAAATVIVTNTGTGPSDSLTASIQGGQSFALDADGCSGTTLAAGSACTLRLHFAPTTSGPSGATLSIVAGAAITTAALSGVGAASAVGSVVLALTPGAQDFGSVAVGMSSASRSFTLRNSGKVATGPVHLSTTGADGADFALTGDGCSGTSLAPGASCSAGVAFSPAAAGARTASLLASDAASGAMATVALSGTALAPASLVLVPTTYDFGSLAIGASSAQQSFTVSNSGGTPSAALTATLGGPDAADFALAADGCTAAVPSSGTCTVALTFTPSRAGAESATLTVAGNGDVLTATLGGTGLPAAAIVLDPSAQSFGTVAEGAAGTDVPFVATNGGGVATGPLAVSIGGTNASQFALGTDGCTGVSLPANGGTCTVALHFAPTTSGSAGSVAATLLVAGSPGGTAAATLTGSAVPGADLVFASPTQAFGNVVGGSNSGDVPVTVTNAGGVASGPLSSVLGGANVTAFGLGADACKGQPLAAGASCVVNVHFVPAPGALGLQQASLSVSAAPGGTATMTLTGNAVTAAALTVAPSSVSWGTIAQGAISPDAAIVVTNGGGVATGVLAVSLGGADEGQFAIAADACTGQTLAPSATCTVSAHFAPSLGTLGTQQATLTVGGTPGGSVPATLIGTASSPLSVAPTTQSLGIAAAGSPSAPVSFTVTNSSATAVGPLAVTLEGANGAQFALGSAGTCNGTKLAPGATCVVAVTLAPTTGTVGAMTAALVVSAGAGTSTQAALTGTAVKSATLAFAATTQSFATVVQGQSSSDVPLTLTNTGGVPSGSVSTSLAGANASQFVVVSDGCAGQIVAAGASCTVTARFSPAAASLGALQATFTASATPGGASIVTLSGTAVTPAALGVSPSSQTFAATVQGSSSADTTFTVTNSGGVPSGALTVSSGTGFVVTADGCTGTTLAATTGSCTVHAHFAPALGVLGTEQAALTVSGTPGGTATANLVGTATTPLSVSPSIGSFPAAAFTAPSAPSAFTVTNASAVAVGPLAVTLGGAAPSAYQLAVGGTCAGATLAGGGAASCVVEVSFAPGQGVTGQQLATLVVSGGVGTSTQAALSGTAVTPAALTISGSGAFGAIVQGQVSGDATFTVTNTGGLTSGPPSATLGGANAGQFALGATTCSAGLAANTSCTVAVHFSPGASVVGLQQATLTVTGNPGGAPAVALSGTAVAQAALSISGGGSFGSVVQGSTSAEATFTLTNGGGVASGPLTVAPPSAPFYLDTDGCAGKSLAPAASCTMTAHYTPPLGALGNQSGTLTASASPGGSVPLSLSGVATAALGISVPSEAFGAYAPGSGSGPFDFTVTNASTAAIGPLQVSFQGTNPTEFTLVGGTGLCQGTTLAGGSSCTVAVAFAPASGTVGTQSAILDVNAGTNLDVQATVSGTSVEPSVLTVSPIANGGYYTFPNELVGATSPTETFTVTNTGAYASNPVEVALDFVGSDFVLTANTCASAGGGTGTLAPGASCTFGVYYTTPAGSTAISESATLLVTSSPGFSYSSTLYGGSHYATYEVTIETNNTCVGENVLRVTYTPPTTVCASYPCNLIAQYGESLTFTATGSDLTFESWTATEGGQAVSCPGTGSCTLTVYGTTTVTANYCDSNVN